jgi:hypothetical protein
LLNYTAVPVVVDIPMVSIVLACLAATALGIGRFGMRAPGKRTAAGDGVTGLFIAGVVVIAGRLQQPVKIEGAEGEPFLPHVDKSTHVKHDH